MIFFFFFFFQAEDGIRDLTVTGVQTCALPISRTWTATDGCGNSATAAQVVTVRDTTAPVFVAGSVPADATNECNAVSAPASPSATDNCDLTPVISFNAVTNAGSCPQRYVITRTWTATDACGNSATAAQVVTVRDTAAPVFVAGSVPADATNECNAVSAPASPGATDNCDLNPAITFNAVTNAGSCPGRYLITRTWTASDNCGNASSASQTVTVVDTTAPVLSGVPANATNECS